MTRGAVTRSTPRCSVLLALLAAIAPVAHAQEPCPRASLPAYSHNDYENANPLTDALALGYRGVEADLFLVDGVLRLGHDRGDARDGKSFETTYLQPLQELLTRCGALSADRRAFLLTIELKEASRETLDSLSALLERYPGLTASDSVSPRSIELVLVGWHPPASAGPDVAPRGVGIQYRITRPRLNAADDDPLVRLVSLDFGKTIGRWWRWPGQKRRWLATLQQAKTRWPHRIVRVHHVPESAGLYRELLAAGVDLIGTETITRSLPLLESHTGARQHDRP